MRWRYLRAITIVIAICGVVGFGLLWRVGSNFHLQHLSYWSTITASSRCGSCGASAHEAGQPTQQIIVPAVRID